MRDAPPALMALPSFFRSIRAKLLLIALLLLLIPFIGFRFIQEMDGYLREGQEQVLVSAAKLLSATLSDRPQLFSSVGENAASEPVERRRLLALFSSADPETAANLGVAYVPSEDIERVLNVVANSASRIWVVDAHSQVRGLAGTLNSRRGSETRTGTTLFAGFYARVIRPVVSLVAADPANPARDDAGLAQRAVMSQVDRALVGEPNARWRRMSEGSGVILSVAQPVWTGDNIVGAVVVEETTGSSQSLKFAALESLLATTVVVFLVGFVALLGFAWRLAFRVRRLQSQADAAIDRHGRISGRIAGSENDDEIGTLARTLDATLQRLSRYNHYLEQMAARLSHELRTPVAVVRSSLDNLRQGGLSEPDRVYIERAEEGVKRLSALISRMAEATQLEGMLQESEKREFDLAKVVRGCFDGYRMAYVSNMPEQFRLTLNNDGPILLHGIPDVIAQLLDKLVQNAVDFTTPGTPIAISLRVSGRKALLSVENTGPPLPESIAGNLFVSMVSSRAQGSAHDGHLGLGLFIVRLIAEFHGGSVRAENLHGAGGVRFEVRLPIVNHAG
ncbi:MAG: ATP-binding protein [Betaproteobacteria bacterium]